MVPMASATYDHLTDPYGRLIYVTALGERPSVCASSAFAATASPALTALAHTGIHSPRLDITTGLAPITSTAPT